jgi:tetratricopeptide (TPR) repeat protein
MRFFTTLSLLLLLTVSALAKSPELTSAKIYMKQGNTEKMYEFLMKAVEAQTGESEVYFLLGEYWAHQGDFRKMNDYFNQAAEINDRFYRKKGRKKIAERRLNYWIELYNSGVRAIQSSNWHKAVDSLRQALVVIPDSSNVYRNLAHCYINLAENAEGDSSKIFLELAADQYRKLIELDSGDLNSYLTLAQIYFQFGDYEQCRHYAGKVLEIDPREIEAVKIIAFSLVHLDRKQEAIDYYQKALELEPQSTALNYDLALLYQEMEDYDNSIMALKRVLEIAPDDLDALKLLGQTYLVYKEDPLAAIPYYEKVVEKEPDNRNAKNNLGIALVKTGDEKNIARGTKLMQEAAGGE